MSLFWNIWIIALTIAAIVLIMWVLLANRRVAERDDVDQENRTTGHVYDGIEEYDNPLPRWWFNLFVLTFVFTVIYLILFPGLGSFPGVLGWTSENRLAGQVADAEERHGDLYADIMSKSVEEIAEDPKLLKMGVRLFSTHCAVCHGADGGGNFGFPNLTDDEWLWGGSPENIKQTLLKGRQGAMPAWGAALGEDGVKAVAEYVLQLSKQEHDSALAEKGQPLYFQMCRACHQDDGSGNILLGAPSLIDDVWLYGGDREGIVQTLRQGRNGVMPPQAETLRKEKIHLLTAYVYNLASQYGEKQYGEKQYQEK